MENLRTKEILDGRYIISEDGDVWATKTGKKIIPHKRVISLYGPEGRISIRINTLVAQTFVPNPKNYEYVAHKDGDYGNYSASNLIWVRKLYKSPDCLAFFDETGVPHLFRSYSHFSQKTGFTRNQELSKLIKGELDSLGPYYSRKAIEEKINDTFTPKDRARVDYLNKAKETKDTADTAHKEHSTVSTIDTIENIETI